MMIREELERVLGDLEKEMLGSFGISERWGSWDRI